MAASNYFISERIVNLSEYEQILRDAHFTAQTLRAKYNAFDDELFNTFIEKLHKATDFEFIVEHRRCFDRKRRGKRLKKKKS